MSFALPDGLPPGRFLSSGLARVWVSDEFPHDIERLWHRLLSEPTTCGLVPLMCRPDAMGRPVGLSDVDAVSLEDVLATDFAEYRRRRLPFWMDPTPAPVSGGVEPWPHDPGPPFEQWPGLAPQMPATSADPTPDEAAASLLAWLIETGQRRPTLYRYAVSPGAMSFRTAQGAARSGCAPTTKAARSRDSRPAPPGCAHGHHRCVGGHLDRSTVTKHSVVNGLTDS
ncbi:hypothetical protein [Streptomyces antnestii]|uniref:hypothetical protein n=1 Tax=Streptomyces antnestii TaxID=2494256 RepID=UPI001CB8F5A5|nr:hypothetical protein [Streptomyces sp. San01]